MLFFKKVQIKRLLKKIKSLQQQRLHSQPSAEVLLKEVGLYHRLAEIYKSFHGKRKYPYARDMVFECYRAAGLLDDAQAQFLVAREMLDQALFIKAYRNEDIFANPRNERLLKQCYEEAHAYLTAAIQLNHIKAKRLCGLCYIKGYGVVADQQKGFEFVVSSIEQENSWDKAPQIFAEMGLNKPEYFSALMKHRSGT
jgi:hypothetical protein